MQFQESRRQIKRPRRCKSRTEDAVRSVSKKSVRKKRRKHRKTNKWRGRVEGSTTNDTQRTTQLSRNQSRERRSLKIENLQHQVETEGTLERGEPKIEGGQKQSEEIMANKEI